MFYFENNRGIISIGQCLRHTQRGMMLLCQRTGEIFFRKIAWQTREQFDALRSKLRNRGGSLHAAPESAASGGNDRVSEELQNVA